MAKAGTSGWDNDISSATLLDMSGITATSPGPGAVDFNMGGGETISLQGPGDFSGFNAHNIPSAGTITHFFIDEEVGGNDTNVDGWGNFSMSFPTFWSYVTSGDASGLLSAVFGGNDMLTGDASTTSPTAGDTLSGYGGNDKFEMRNAKPGAYADLSGGDGSDTFFYNGGNFDGATDTVDGGAGTDRLVLFSQYPSVTTLSHVTDVEIIVLETVGAAVPTAYDLVAANANVAGGRGLTVDGTALQSADSLTFDASGVSAGHFSLKGGAGNDDLIGGAGNDNLSGGDGNDTIDISAGGNDVVSGGAGDDTIIASNHSLALSDRVDGGTGNDILEISGNYVRALDFKAATVTNIATITVGAGFDYRIVSNDATVAAGQTMTVDGSALGSGNWLNFNGAQETDGNFVLIGGAGNDTLAGGAGNDTFTGGAGADTLTANGAAVTFIYQSVSDSTGREHDIIVGFDALADHVQLSFAVNAIDAEVTTGTLRNGHFDANLAADIGAGRLGAHDALLFTPGAGLTGHTYLVIDANGVAGYQAGQDYVIELSSAANLGSLGTANFTN